MLGGKQGTPRQQRSFFADDKSDGSANDSDCEKRKKAKTTPLRKGLSASGLTARSTKSTPTAALRVDITAQYAHEDRLRVAARRDRDRSDSEDEPGPKVSGVRVFALSARKSRTMLTPTRDLIQSESGKPAPSTPSLLSAAKLQRSITLSNETDVSSTPLKRSSRLTSALNPLNVLSPASPAVATPKRTTRASVAATPRGRTPDMKRAAKQRVEEILNESESDSEDEDEEEDEEEDMEEDEGNGAENLGDHMDPYASIASAVERGEDDEDDAFIEPSRFGHKESDFDRDVKRRGKVRANVEDYFTESSARKGPKRNQTSNNTLSSLPTLSREEYLSALTTMPQKHVREREGLTFLIPSYFRQWNFELSQGYSLLLYGYGSKRSIVSMFKEQFCKDAPVMTLNGYMPVVNFATDVLSKIVTNIVLPESLNAATKSSPASKTMSTRKPITPAAQIAAIASYFKNPDRTHSHITLLINNIDGPSLRSEKQQILISTLLRTCPRGTLRLVATVDHINAPLLWDRSTADAFHWLWKDVTTYEPYFEETQYGALCFVPEAKGGVKGGVSGGGSGSSASGAVHVLRSLNQNARRMFKILADWQLLESRSNNEVEAGVTASNRKGRRRKAGRKAGKTESDSDDDGRADSTADEGQSPDRNERNAAPTTAGMPYNGFLTRCIESFCVNSQDNFKAQLAEFRDHGIILRKRGSSLGEEVVYIPFGKDALENILSQVTV
ncbi:Origin recognition complex subunit 2 [Chytriomyces hyalinus]|nr:Origin recognition complex subunit 2 [Chytriomyces hyalinus]